MGPIRIELSLNGESARIAFAAAHPETRQAIERSLPILADMLAAHSLQLDGASVSDHPARHGQPDRDPGRTPSGRHDDRGGGGDPTAADAVDPAAGPRPARLAARGLLDLYA
ncbi:MAG: flagellar hook-length control protein FliK [Burkholderiaceae bacterium]